MVFRWHSVCFTSSMMKAKLIYTRTTNHSVQRFYRLDRPLILSNLQAVSELMVSSLCLPTETSVHLYPVHDEGIAWEPLAMVVGLSAELGETEALDAMLLEMMNIEKRKPTRQTVHLKQRMPRRKPTRYFQKRILSSAMASLNAIMLPKMKISRSAQA